MQVHRWGGTVSSKGNRVAFMMVLVHVSDFDLNFGSSWGWFNNPSAGWHKFFRCGLYAYMHIYIHIYIHTHTHIYIYIYIYIYMYIYMHIAYILYIYTSNICMYILYIRLWAVALGSRAVGRRQIWRRVFGGSSPRTGKSRVSSWRCSWGRVSLWQG